MSTIETQDRTDPPDGHDVVERDPRRWLVLAVMALGTLIVFLDLTVVNTALPAISVDLGASTSELQWVVDSYVLVLAGLLMLAGSIGDRYGRKRWMATAQKPWSAARKSLFFPRWPMISLAMVWHSGRRASSF